MLLKRRMFAQNCKRAVMVVCGGSGVGKSEIASLLSYYLNQLGVGSYTLSGDNYPHRIPRDNDAERLRVFREGGLRGLVASRLYTREMGDILRELWAEELDAQASKTNEHPWFAAYQQSDCCSLFNYLGMPLETNFDQVSDIISRFKQSADTLPLKHMGRQATELWYDLTDMRSVSVLVIEWTHGNSDWIEGVDIPILLNSASAETLAHRSARNWDGKTDSTFTIMLLELEQKKLATQAHKAKLILSKAGELMDYTQYRQLIAQA